MTLASRLVSLSQALGADYKSLRTTMLGSVGGSLTDLNTSNRTSLLAAINEVQSEIWKAWPVGSIHMTVSPTNPATTIGFGTWVAWGSGQVPVGVDSAQTEFSSVELTGGAKTVTLDSTQIPAHTHPATSANKTVGADMSLTDRTSAASAGSSVAVDAGVSGVDVIIAGSSHNHTITVGSNTGGGGAHNNLQPYITCYMWKRTA